MPIRLLALDLDGTLLNSRGELTDRNRETIAAARARGVRVAVVTGRRFRDARPIALELGLDVPLISHNGALTRHARTLETIALFPLPLQAAREALALGRASGADPLLSDDLNGLGVLVYDKLSGENPALAKYVAWAHRIHGDDGAVQETTSLEDYLDHDPVHLTFTGTCSAMTQLNDELQSELGTTARVFSTMYPKLDFALLDVLNPAASKGTGVAAAAAELNLSADEVMAIGDNYNDLEMLRYAGTGVLMGNAVAALSDSEGLQITGTNDEDGVAQAIEKFIL
ncbi:MAG TPA: Cof-type HAD-IIB family hydrolase [Pyrinomonadaceae bacterium]|nr:Cof-type HAD-IIB family hydrolase [Pyrinomonadaceae bacterium]